MNSSHLFAQFQNLESFPKWMWAGIGVLVIWDLIWKGYSLWKSAKNDQSGWFIAMLIINSAGILPIIYLLFFQKDKK